MRTKEQSRLIQKRFRARHAEKVRANDRLRYRLKRGEEARVKRMGAKHCRLCEIRLAGRYGGFGTKFYCRSCVDSGQAKRHSILMATRRYREKI